MSYALSILDKSHIPQGMRFLGLPLTGSFRSAAFLACVSFYCAHAVADTAAAGISPAFVRLSIGIEDPDAIIKDIDQALEGV